ncbi:unnamed protein product, partial [Prorocentrum cordatum]
SYPFLGVPISGAQIRGGKGTDATILHSSSPPGRPSSPRLDALRNHCPERTPGGPGSSGIGTFWFPHERLSAGADGVIFPRLLPAGGGTRGQEREPGVPRLREPGELPRRACQVRAGARMAPCVRVEGEHPQGPGRGCHAGLHPGRPVAGPRRPVQGGAGLRAVQLHIAARSLLPVWHLRPLLCGHGRADQPSDRYPAREVWRPGGALPCWTHLHAAGGRHHRPHGRPSARLRGALSLQAGAQRLYYRKCAPHHRIAVEAYARHTEEDIRRHSGHSVHDAVGDGAVPLAHLPDQLDLRHLLVICQEAATRALVAEVGGGVQTGGPRAVGPVLPLQGRVSGHRRRRRGAVGPPGGGVADRIAGGPALAKEMVPGAFLVALVTFLSSFAGAKKFAMKAGYQVVAMNELIALGLANIVGSLCAAVPTQIGLSRMGIAYAAGIRSQLGTNVYVAVVVAASIYAFSACLYYIPRCVLNAIIVNGASHLVEFDHMLWLWSLKACPGSKRDSGSRMFRTDFSVWWFSCLGTLYFGAFEGIVLTVLLSLALVVHQVVHPSITPLGCEVGGDKRTAGAEVRGWRSLANPATRPREGVLVFRVEGPLFYANISRVQEWLEDAELRGLQRGRRPLRAIVLMAASVPFVDSTALMAFKTMVEAYADRGVHFLIAKAAGQPKRFFLHVYSEESRGPPGAHAFAADAVRTCVDGDFSVEDCIAWLQDHESGRLRRASSGRSSQAASSEVLPDAGREAAPPERAPSGLSHTAAFEEPDEMWPPLAPQPLRKASLWASLTHGRRTPSDLGMERLLSPEGPAARVRSLSAA